MSQTRSKARRCAVQALYQWQIAHQDVTDVYQQFVVERDMAKVNVEYFRELLYGVVTNLDKLDQQLQPFLDRSLDEVDPVERAVLRMGAFELIYKPDVPYRVAINEALEAAKMFGAEHGHKYVNGVLDKVAQATRRSEMKRSRK